jgi:hypothetical protein
MLEYLGVELNGIGFLVGRRVIHTARVHELRKKGAKIKSEKKRNKKVFLRYGGIKQHQRSPHEAMLGGEMRGAAEGKRPAPVETCLMSLSLILICNVIHTIAE